MLACLVDGDARAAVRGRQRRREPGAAAPDDCHMLTFELDSSSFAFVPPVNVPGDERVIINCQTKIICLVWRGARATGQEEIMELVNGSFPCRGDRFGDGTDPLRFYR